MSNKLDFNQKRGFICDMDGVIYYGNRILPGVREFIQWLQDEKTKKTHKLSFWEWTIDKKKIWNNINDRCLFCICEKRFVFVKTQAVFCAVFGEFTGFPKVYT